MGPTESHEVLHSFCINPGVRFDTQGPNERVILILRAHPITQIPWIFNTIFFIILLILGNIFAPLIFNGPQIFFLNIFILAFIFAYVWFNFLSWFFNVGIITNERILDVDFINVLYKEVTATRLSKVEDVTAKSGGYIRSLFNYGNVFVQTAGEEVNIEFLNVPFPSRVVEIINELTPV
jgi:membrane protein YdbS with pleckstrin-like domain